ncbi:MAG: hypothetical protein BGO87_09830 [Flavobacteriia bacterium 40-80]|nr:MAG: hypothetical protein BGO87_09830 [Flavobacteriia bacterium 40-80]
MNNYKYWWFVFATIITSFSLSQTKGRLVYYEQTDEPVKAALINIYNLSNDSIIESVYSDNDGNFQFISDTSIIGEITVNHLVPAPLIPVIYKRGYTEFISNGYYFLFKMVSFDYFITTSRDEAFFYRDISSFLEQRFSKVLYLKNCFLYEIPNIKQLKRHGVKALFLNQNNIKVIPPKLLKIKELKFVDLSENPLDEKSIRLIREAHLKGITVIYD